MPLLLLLKVEFFDADVEVLRRFVTRWRNPVGVVVGENVRAAVHQVVFEPLGRFRLDGKQAFSFPFDLFSDVEEQLVRVRDGFQSGRSADGASEARVSSRVASWAAAADAAVAGRAARSVGGDGSDVGTVGAVRRGRLLAGADLSLPRMQLLRRRRGRRRGFFHVAVSTARAFSFTPDVGGRRRRCNCRLLFAFAHDFRASARRGGDLSRRRHFTHTGRTRRGRSAVAIRIFILIFVLTPTFTTSFLAPVGSEDSLVSSAAWTDSRGARRWAAAAAARAAALLAASGSPLFLHLVGGGSRQGGGSDGFRSLRRRRNHVRKMMPSRTIFTIPTTRTRFLQRSSGNDNFQGWHLRTRRFYAFSVFPFAFDTDEGLRTSTAVTSALPFIFLPSALFAIVSKRVAGLIFSRMRPLDSGYRPTLRGRLLSLGLRPCAASIRPHSRGFFVTRRTPTASAALVLLHRRDSLPLPASSAPLPLSMVPL
uniref:Uncharacterized protein n=1 Tax=Lygus hesperus TaxID=30085 RepID=A0A0A9XAX6_LYGHE